MWLGWELYTHGSRVARLGVMHTAAVWLGWGLYTHGSRVVRLAEEISCQFLERIVISTIIHKVNCYLKTKMSSSSI